MTMFAYGLKARPFDLNAQPRGYIDWQEFESRCELPCGEKVWSIVWYSEPLKASVISDYEMVRLECEDKPHDLN